MVKDHSDSEKVNLLPTLRGLLFLISSNGSFICNIPETIAHTTVFATPVVEHPLENKLAEWVHHDRSILQPNVPRAKFTSAYSRFQYANHVPWVNSPPKLVFNESFVLATLRWGYHHSPCDSLSLLLRYMSNLLTVEGRQEMFYLTRYSTHFIYSYKASDI